MVHRKERLAAVAVTVLFLALSSRPVQGASSYPQVGLGACQAHLYEGTIDALPAGSELILLPSIVNGATSTTVTLEIDVPFVGSFERSLTEGVTCTGAATISCTLPTIAQGATFTPELLVRLPPSGGKATYVAALRAGLLGRVSDSTQSFSVVARDARLSVQMVPSPASVAAGGAFVETMRVKNSGTHYTTPVTVTATMSSTLTASSLTGAACSLAPAVRCTDIILAPGQSIDLAAELHASNTNAIATFTGSATSFTTSAVTAGANVIIGGDVASTVTLLDADRNSATPGQPLTYTAKVMNTGPGDAYGVKTRIVLNSGGTITAAAGTPPTVCAIQQQPYIVDCDTPTLANGTSSTGTVSVVAPLFPSSLTLTATTTLINGPSQSVAASTPVDSTPSDVAVTVQERAQSAVAGQRSVLHFDVTNAGGTDAANVFFDATFGTGLALVSIETTAGSCIGTHCAIGTLKAGATEHLTLTVAGVSAGAQTIDGAVLCDAEDGSSENNRVSATINVTAARTRGVRH
jgi:uncharacterized repeat protein (TIGR01451 family)